MSDPQNFVTYYPQADAAYLHLKHPIANGEAQRTLVVSDDVLVDFDKDGRPLGIDIEFAKESLGVSGEPSLSDIVQAVKPQIAAATQSQPGNAELYQRVLDLLK